MARKPEPRTSCVLALVAAVLFLAECSSEPTPFDIVIENPTETILFVPGLEQPEPRIYTEVDGRWDETGSIGPSGCYRPCGKVGQSVCPNIAPDDTAYALMPGDQATFSSSGEAFQLTRDAFGECRGVKHIEGPVLAEICSVDWAYSPVEEEEIRPTESGGFEPAWSEFEVCVDVQMVLPDEIEGALTLTWP